MGLEVAAVVGVAAAVGNYQTQSAMANASKEHNEQVIQNMVDNYHQLAGAEVDTLDASYDASLQAQTDYLQAKAQAQNVAAATGTAGGSVDMLLGELSRQKAEGMAEIIQNRETAFADIQAQAKSIENGANANLQAIKKPSVTQAVIAGVQTGASVYALASGVGAAAGGAGAAGAGAGAGAAGATGATAGTAGASGISLETGATNILL